MTLSYSNEDWGFVWGVVYRLCFVMTGKRSDQMDRAYGNETRMSSIRSIDFSHENSGGICNTRSFFNHSSWMRKIIILFVIGSDWIPIMTADLCRKRGFLYLNHHE